MYSRAWNQWNQWCSFMEYSPWLPQQELNASTAQLGAFAVYLWRFGMNQYQRGNSYGTICTKLCAVRWHHRNTMGYDPGVNAQHALLLRGIRRFSDPVKKCQPLTPVLLRNIYGSLNLRQPQHQLLWGGLLLAYLFLLRRSEYLYIGRRCHQYILKLSDLRFCDIEVSSVRPKRASVIGICLYGAKNNQFGREDVRFQHATRDPILCPVHAA